MWAIAGAEFLLSRAGSTTEMPRLSDNQILPAESAITDLCRLTPSRPRRPSASPYSCTSSSSSVPSNSFFRFTRNTWADVATHSDPTLSSAIPRISSLRAADVLRGDRKRSPLRSAIPDAVPTQSTPAESSKTEFMLSEGRPSEVVYVRQWSCEKVLSPLGVANHMDASEASRTDMTLFEARPLAIV